MKRLLTWFNDNPVSTAIIVGLAFALPILAVFIRISEPAGKLSVSIIEPKAGAVLKVGSMTNVVIKISPLCGPLEVIAGSPELGFVKKTGFTGTEFSCQFQVTIPGTGCYTAHVKNERGSVVTDSIPVIVTE